MQCRPVVVFPLFLRSSEISKAVNWLKEQGAVTVKRLSKLNLERLRFPEDFGAGPVALVEESIAELRRLAAVKKADLGAGVSAASAAPSMSDSAGGLCAFVHALHVCAFHVRPAWRLHEVWNGSLNKCSPRERRLKT